MLVVPGACWSFRRMLVVHQSESFSHTPFLLDSDVRRGSTGQGPGHLIQRWAANKKESSQRQLWEHPIQGIGSRHPNKGVVPEHHQGSAGHLYCNQTESKLQHPGHVVSSIIASSTSSRPCCFIYHRNIHKQLLLFFLGALCLLV